MGSDASVDRRELCGRFLCADGRLEGVYCTQRPRENPPREDDGGTHIARSRDASPTKPHARRAGRRGSVIEPSCLAINGLEAASPEDEEGKRGAKTKMGHIIGLRHGHAAGGSTWRVMVV